MLRPKLNRLWASQSANSRRDPGDAKYLVGWVSEIPTFQVLNYLQYKVDTTILAQAERGIFEWGNDIQYKLGSLVWNEIDGYIYISIVGAPDKNKSPNTNPTQWSTSSIQVTRAQYDDIVASITSHMADVTSNPHKVSANDVNTYNKAQIDTLVAQYQALVKAHVDDKNNPHGVTAAQVGAVPITGGTYTGDVTFQAGLFLTTDKTKSVTKTGGLFLQSGNNVIGISDQGVACAGKSGSASPLVTEASFAALKLAREPEYATQYPSVAMDLIQNINIRTGGGTFDSNAVVVQYEQATGAFLFKNDSTGGDKQMRGQDYAFGEGLYNATIAVDIKSTSPRVASDNQSTWTIGTDNFHLYETGAGRIGLELIDRKANPVTYPGVVANLPAAVNTWYRIVGVWDGQNHFKLYVNGELVNRVDTGTSVSQLTGSPIVFAVKQRAVADQRTYQIRNLRIWPRAMSAQAVSTL